MPIRRIMVWHCPFVSLSVCPFRDTHFQVKSRKVLQVSSWNLVYHILPKECACLNKDTPSIFWDIIPLKIGQNWSKMRKNRSKTPGPSEFTWMPVNAQGAFIWRQTVIYGGLPQWPNCVVEKWLCFLQQNCITFPERPPVHRGHLWPQLWVAAVNRSDCM